MLWYEQLPRDGWALANRAEAYVAAAKWKLAAKDLRQATDLQANGEYCRRLAWLLWQDLPDRSTCDGKQAVTLAERAIKLTGESSDNLDTLAGAALAAAGQFERARDVQSRVIAMLETEDPSSKVKQAAYENNERYQETFDR